MCKDNLDFVLSNKTKLNKGIFTDKEYPPEIESKRKILRPIFTAAKNSAKYRKRCKMDKDQLVIKGKRYGVEDMDTLPKYLKPANITSKANDKVYGYFRELHPFSNFHPAKFSYENKVFHCSEQFIQWKKAEFFKDTTAMNRIEKSKTGRQSKEEGRKIKNFKKTTWDIKAKDICKAGIRQKFIENKKPRDLLLSKTKGKKIAECTKDDVWGCGLALNNDKCLNSTMWTSQGIMGVILEEIRDELIGKTQSVPNTQPDVHKQPLPGSSTVRSDSPESTDSSDSSDSGSDSSSSNDQENPGPKPHHNVSSGNTDHQT